MTKVAEPLNSPHMYQSISIGPSIPKPRDNENYQMGAFPRLTAHYSHLFIFLPDELLSFWICPWWDSRDREVSTTLSCQLAEERGKGG